MIEKSFHLLRTNTAITTNVKFVVTSKYEFFLESIESDRFLNQDRFKKFRITKDNLLNTFIPEFFKNVPEDIAYVVKYDNDQDIMYNSFDYQYDPLYFTGSKTVDDKSHEEEFEYFAPLHINPNYIPKCFVIFRVDGPGKIDLTNINFRSEIVDNFKVVSMFDIEKTELGSFLDLNFKNKYFPNSPLELDFREFEFSRWNGIDYLSGGFSSKSFFLNDTFKNELPFFEMDKFITNGYKKNSVIYPNILNLTFLFDDTPASSTDLKKYSINRYLGFYIDDLDLIETLTPYKTYQLISNGNITNNIFYDTNINESYDPIVGGWKSDKEYFIYNNNKYHYLTRTLVGINEYEYKIISDTLFDTNTNALHITDLFNIINTQSNTIITYYNNTLSRTEIQLSDNNPLSSTLNPLVLNTGDVFLIKIDNKYYTLKYDLPNDVYYINSDYRIDSNTDKIKYWINGEDSEYTTEILLNNISKQNKPPVYEIYRVKFTEIADFDNDIKDTKFAGYEYEDTTSSYRTNETKFYANDYSTSSSDTELITDNPVSSEYLANDEYYAFDKDDKLNDLWRKNPVLCKWGAAGSISHNDYSYKVNNSINNIDPYNRAPNPKLLELNRRNANLDYFYTLGYPVGNYNNHSLHLTPEFLNLSNYINNTNDYFSLIFESQRDLSDGTNDFKHNTYKYSVFNSGDNYDSPSCIYRGAKFKIHEVDNILKDGNEIKQISIKNSNKYNDYKFSIVFASKRYDSTNNYTLFTGVEANIGESGIDVYVNHKYKNILVHIYINSDNNLSDVYSIVRDDLYSTGFINETNIGPTTLNASNLVLSNIFSALNSVNSKFGFDNYLTYWVIEENGSFDLTQTNSKLNYNSSNILPFYLTVEYPEELEVNLNSLLTVPIEIPNLVRTNQPLLYPGGSQPYARKFKYNKIDQFTNTIDSRGIFPETVSIYRFNGSYMPIFKRIEMFKAYTGVNGPGNYIFNENLTDFGITKEQKISKVNRFDNLFKLKNDKNTPSLYPMIDELGYSLINHFLFKSTWDNTYYVEVENNNNVPISLTDGVKTSYLAEEFNNNNINGTFNMKEQKSFFGSKGMDIEDSIIINENSILFFEDSNTHEQISGSLSETLNSNYNFNTLKGSYHSIEQKKLQTDLEREELTKWVINLKSQELLKDYLFASIKKARSFENVTNSTTISNSTDLSIKSYIDFNLLDRYGIERIDFYVQYFLIEDNPSLMKYDPLYDVTVKQNYSIGISNTELTTSISVTGSVENDDLKIEYVQTKNSLDYKFDYYFDIIFKRI